jgi:hypothetical protein
VTTKTKAKTRSKPMLGWREWVALDSLGLPPMKAKVDTGARTSALHAFRVRGFRRHGQPWVRFQVHPHQDDRDTSVLCEAPVLDRRWVTDSGGHAQRRYVILVGLWLKDTRWPVEITLTNRDTMRFRMLLGRTALENRYIVDPGASFLCGGNARQVPPHFQPIVTTNEL